LRLKSSVLPFICLFFTFFLFCASANAGDLNLDDAVSRALEYNLSLKKSEIDLASSGYSEKHIWSEIFPSISASASAGYTDKLFSEITPQRNGFNYSVGFGISLGLNAGIPYTMKNIKLAHQNNLLKYDDARNQLSIQVTKLFYSLTAEQNNILLLEEVFNLAQRQYTKSEASFKNGLVGELSLTQSSLALENARYNLSAAKITHINNMSDFLATLGMPADEEIILLGEVKIIKIDADAEQLIKEYLPKRPDIIKAEQEIERLTLAQRQTLFQSKAPSLSLSVDWNSSNFDPFSDTISATARVSLPIDTWIPGTAKAQNILKANDAIEKAKLDLASTENSAKTQIRSLSALLHNSWDSVLIARLSLEAAQRSYQLTEQGFNNGVVELLTLQDARNNMANARQRLLQTELSYFNMILDLSSAINIDWKNIIQIFGVPSEEK